MLSPAVLWTARTDERDLQTLSWAPFEALGPTRLHPGGSSMVARHRVFWYPLCYPCLFVASLSQLSEFAVLAIQEIIKLEGRPTNLTGSSLCIHGDPVSRQTGGGARPGTRQPPTRSGLLLSFGGSRWYPPDLAPPAANATVPSLTPSPILGCSSNARWLYCISPLSLQSSSSSALSPHH